MLPLRRAPAYAEQEPIPVPNQSPDALLGPEEHSGPAGLDVDIDEPAWRRAFVTPDGVRFTRTPDRVLRERRGIFRGDDSGPIGDEEEASFEAPAQAWESGWAWRAASGKDEPSSWFGSRREFHKRPGR